MEDADAISSLRAENAALRNDIAGLRREMTDIVETQALLQNMPPCGGDFAAWCMATRYSRSYLYATHCPADICELVRSRVLAPVFVGRNAYGGYVVFSDGKFSYPAPTVVNAPANISCEDCPIFYTKKNRLILDAAKNIEYKTNLRLWSGRHSCTKMHVMEVKHHPTCDFYSLKIAHKKQCGVFSTLWDRCFEGKAILRTQCDTDANHALALIECANKVELTIFDINRAVSPTTIPIDSYSDTKISVGCGAIPIGSIGLTAPDVYDGIVSYAAYASDPARMTLMRGTAIILFGGKLYSADVRERCVSLLSECISAKPSKIIATDENRVMCADGKTLCVRDIRSGFRILSEYEDPAHISYWWLTEYHFCAYDWQKFENQRHSSRGALWRNLLSLRCGGKSLP